MFSVMTHPGFESLLSLGGTVLIFDTGGFWEAIRRIRLIMCDVMICMTSSEISPSHNF